MTSESAPVCDRCCRKIWDPVPAGWMLHCFGHIDNIEGVFVSPERKKNYRVKACELFLELPPAAAKASDTKISTKNTHTTQRKNGSNVQKRRDFL